jgi:hypothetical protein
LGFKPDSEIVHSGKLPKSHEFPSLGECGPSCSLTRVDRKKLNR